MGLRMLTDHLQNGGEVSIPTETTYEKVALWKEDAPCRHSSRPHVYVLDVGHLETSPFWKPLFEAKAYGIRCDDTTVLAKFNESIAVLQRIAPTIWPGPVRVYVQVKCSVPGVSVSVNGSTRVRHYIKLRSPRHPLALRACKEFTVAPPPQEPSSPVAAAGSPPRLAHKLPNPPMVSPLRLTSVVLPLPSPTMPRRATSSGSLSSAHSTSSTSLAAAVTITPQRTLLGWPVVDEKDNFCTAARDVPTGLVLNGEESREILRVPTCDVPMASVGTIYLDAPTRTVAIHGDVPDISWQLQSAAVVASPTSKEKVTQALLRKWRVVRLEKAPRWA